MREFPCDYDAEPVSEVLLRLRLSGRANLPREPYFKFCMHTMQTGRAALKKRAGVEHR